MGYEIPLKLAWDELDRLGLETCSVPFLGEEYLVRRGDRAVREPSGQPAGEMEAVLVLHYLIGLSGRVFSPTGSWISFKEAPAGVTFWARPGEEHHQAAGRGPAEGGPGADGTPAEAAGMEKYGGRGYGPGG